MADETREQRTERLARALCIKRGWNPDQDVIPAHEVVKMTTYGGGDVILIDQHGHKPLWRMLVPVVEDVDAIING